MKYDKILNMIMFYDYLTKTDQFTLDNYLDFVLKLYKIMFRKFGVIKCYVVKLDNLVLHNYV